MYAAVNNLNVLSSFDCFKRTVPVHDTSHSRYMLIRPHARTVLCQNSVSINSISIWNNLAPTMALSPSIAQFKASMFCHLLNKYLEY